MAYKVAFVNGKGGCGKTTSIFHVAGVLAKSGQRVLVIDLDKQRNASDVFLMNNQKNRSLTVLNLLKNPGLLGEGSGVYESLWQTRANANCKYYGVDVIPADVRLEDESVFEDTDAAGFAAKLDEYIKKWKYDWVLVDMPPSSMTINEICMSHIVDFVIVPFTSDVFSVSGYGDLVESVNRARGNNESLHILGIYLARYMANSEVDKYIREQLRGFGDIFIDVQIPLRTDIREAVMFGRPISYYKAFSPGKTAYEDLVKEMKRRIKAVI